MKATFVAWLPLEKCVRSSSAKSKRRCHGAETSCDTNWSSESRQLASFSSTVAALAVRSRKRRIVPRVRPGRATGRALEYRQMLHTGLEMELFAPRERRDVTG